MTTITLSNNPGVSSWETATNNTSVSSNIAGVTLTGIPAAAYLFGQALRSVDGDAFGQAQELRIARNTVAFEFPAGSGNLVSISEIADALHYKFGCDPLIEFSSDVGANGYSLADINLILQRLNKEYLGQFSLETLSLRDITQSMAPVTELNGRTSDVLLSDELSNAQKQALADLAQQIKTFAQSWLATLGSPTDPVATLLRSSDLDNGLSLSTTSTLAVPGQTVSITEIIHRAGQALGLDMAARFPDLFSGGKLRLNDVNLLLAAAREANPSLANDLADVNATQGTTHAGVNFTGQQALLVHAADVLSGLTLTSGTSAPRIGWDDAVFQDPFGGANLSANQLQARLAPTGFDPFAYLGSPLPDYLSLSDINAFLAQVNTELNLSGTSSYSVLNFQFKDGQGNNITPRQAYLNQVMQGLASAGTSTALSGVWSPDYDPGVSVPTSDYSYPTGQYWQLSMAVEGLTNYSDPYNGYTPNLQNAIRATIPSTPVVGTVYLRRVYNTVTWPSLQSQLGAYRWNGSSFDVINQVNALDVNDANLAAIGEYWTAHGVSFDGLSQINQINLRDYDSSSAPAGSPARLIAATELGMAPPYFSAMNQIDGGGIQHGEWFSKIDGARGYAQVADWTTINAALIAAGGNSYPPNKIGVFQAPTVASTKYYDQQGNEVQNLVSGGQYKVVVTLSTPWPDSTAIRQAWGWPYYYDDSGFWNRVQMDQWTQTEGGVPTDDDGIRVNWNRSAVTPNHEAGHPDFWTSFVWSKVGTDGMAVQADFTANTNTTATGTVSIQFLQDQWMRFAIPGGIVDYPMNTNTLQMLGLTNDNVGSKLVGWVGGNPQTQLAHSQSLSAALFEYPPGSGTRLTLAQLSQALARDYTGNAAVGNNADGALDLVDWFMGKGAAYSGSAQGWSSQYDTVGQAALAYQTTPGTLPVVGLGAWNDPSGAKPLSEWSLKAGLFSLWWNFYLVRAEGDGAGNAVAAGMQPVVSGPAQLGVVASAALSAKTLAAPLAGARKLSVVGTLTDAQRAAFHLQSVNQAVDASGNLTDELAQFRRVFKGNSQAGMALADFSGLSASTRTQMVSAAKGIESGLLDSSVINRLAFGERIGFDEPLFLNAQGEPASLSALLGGSDATLTQRLKATMPGLVDLGLNFDDLRRVLSSAAALDPSIVPTQLDDPARVPIKVDDKVYEGGAAVLLRIAASLRSVSEGTYANAPLDAAESVFANPIQPGATQKWSINDLNLLARRSAGYTALNLPAQLYDTDLDATLRQLELAVGRTSTISLSSHAVSDDALSWFAKQLVVPGGASLALLADANADTFGPAGSTKSFMEVLSDVQRLYGSELSPRLQALGILQAGPLRTVVNVNALNRFLTWEKARDPSVTSAALNYSPASTSISSLSSYGQSAAPLQSASREIQALASALSPWQTPDASATDAQWRATQQRLASLVNALGDAASAALNTNGAAGVLALKQLAMTPDSPLTNATLVVDARAAVTAALNNVQVSLQDRLTELDTSTLNFSSVMGSWDFASDDASLISDQQDLMAAMDTQQVAIRQAWQGIRIGNSGSPRPDGVATSEDGRVLSGAQAQAVLIAQALGSLDASAQQLASLDVDTALFTDPAYVGSAAVRTMSGGSAAKQISLRQLAARSEGVLGFNPVSEYAPDSGPWTVARVNGLIQLLNDALGFTAATPYTVTPLALGDAQGLRDKIVAAQTGELVIPKALRAPLLGLVNHLGELSQADLASGGTAALDSNGFFDAHKALFRSAPGLASPDLSFDQLVAAGASASPSLADLLQRLGIEIGGRASARGLNNLIDVARAEFKDEVKTTPWVLPAAIQAIDATATVTLEEYQRRARDLAIARAPMAQIQALIDEWTPIQGTPTVDLEFWWGNWKARLQEVLDAASAAKVTLPIDQTKLDAVLALNSPPATISADYLTTLRARIVAGMNAAYTAFSNIWVAGDVNDASNVYDGLYIPFQRAVGAVDVMQSLLAQVPQPSIASIITDTKNWAKGQWTSYNSGYRTDWYGLPALVTPWNLSVHSELYQDTSDPNWDFMSWLTQFDMPTDWLTNPVNRQIPGNVQQIDANAYFDVNKWANDGYPGAIRLSDSYLTSALAPWNDLVSAFNSAPDLSDASLRSLQIRFDWSQTAEQLMLEQRQVDVPAGREGLWYQVANALQNINPDSLPEDGSGSAAALFEYPPGSGQRYNLQDFRRLINQSVSVSFDLLAGVSGDIDFDHFTALDRNRLLAAIYQAMPDVAKAMVDWPQPVVAAGDEAFVTRLAKAVGADLEGFTNKAVTFTETTRTDVELRQDLSKGSDIYVNRNGAYYINGVPTRPMDLVVVSRYLAHDDLSTQYKTLLNGLNERNNLISAARTLQATLTSIDNGTFDKPSDWSDWVNMGYEENYYHESLFTPLLTSLKNTYGWSDPMSELTGGKYHIDGYYRWYDAAGNQCSNTTHLEEIRKDLAPILNTLISNKVRDGDLDQSKLQSITAQLQNNIEAMTALIKAFTELNSTLAQALK